MEGIRNAVRLPDGRIDCEVEHPQFGWIPFTADADDVMAHGREVFAALETKNPPDKVIPTPTGDEILAAERARMICSRFQAKAALLQAGLLPRVDTLMAAADPMAKLAWSEVVEFRRNSPTITALATAAGLTETQVDDLFRAAMGITA